MQTVQPLYLQVASHLSDLITSGSLRVGDRIPSVRRLSRQQKVSVPTILRAYMELESRRLIEARPKSGFYVRPRLAEGRAEPAAADRTTTAPWADFHATTPIVRDLANPAFVPLGGAIPSPDLLPTTKLSRIVGTIAREQANEVFSYDSAPGSERLRREISRRSLDWGCHLSAEEFVITNGATEAIHLALRATTQPGDAVLIESPAYYGFIHVLNQIGLKAVAVPAHARDGLDLAAVERAIKKHRIAAILLVPSFSNPLGSLMPESHRRALLQLTARKDIPIIEDDIYGDLQHEGHRPRCLKAFDSEGRVLLCGSYSKTLAPGFRVGFVAAGRYQARIVHLKVATSLGNATLPALAVAEFLRNGGYDHHLRRIRRTYRDQVHQTREAVAASFPPAVRISNPRGGFVLWVELPAGTDAMRLFSAARQAGISIAPGPIFSPLGAFSNYLRLSCGFPWNEKMEAAIATLGRLVRQAQHG